MDLRITNNVTDDDINEIHSQLRIFNRAHRESSSDEPIGIFLESPDGKKQAKLSAIGSA